MPDGPTTYPTLGERIRIKARTMDDGFYPGSVDDLFTIANTVDLLLIDLAKRRQDTADADRLAAHRDRIADGQHLRIRELEQQAEHWSQTLSEVSAGFNRLAAENAELVAYVMAQPCACSEHELRTDPAATPCDRCRALGRRMDIEVER